MPLIDAVMWAPQTNGTFTRRGRSPIIAGFVAFTPGTTKPIGYRDEAAGLGIRNVGPRFSDLTVWEGDYTLAPGVPVNKLDIQGRLIGRGDSATVVSDCIIRGGPALKADDSAVRGTSLNLGGITIQWSRIEVGAMDGFTDAIDGGNYKLRYSEVYGGTDGIGANNYGAATVECCRISHGYYDSWWDRTTRTVTINGSPTGGTFTLSFNGATTTAIAYNAAASTVQSALRALSTVGSGNATVSGSGPYTVTFNGAAIDTLSPFTGTSSLTGGSSPSVSVTAANAKRSTAYTDTDGGTHVTPFPAQTSGDLHGDGCQIQQFSGWVLRGNYIGGSRPAPYAFPDKWDPTNSNDWNRIKAYRASSEYITSCILVSSATSAAKVGALIELNWLEGGNARFNIAYKSYDNMAGIVFRNNRMIRSPYGYYILAQNQALNAATISGNVMDDDGSDAPIFWTA